MSVRLRVKRAIDIVGAVLALVLVSPVMLFVALLVRLRLGSPVVFRQLRPGFHAEPFVLYKFRTMRDAVDPDGQPLPDGERLTPLGRTLRRYSLDELPQFWNVLRGDMSLVGPRPLLMEYLDRYSPDQARRHEVKPGITGLAQVSGRNTVSWDQKFSLDVWYVEHWSLWLDLQILLSTVRKVLAGDGAWAPGGDTMQVYNGPLENPEERGHR